MIKFFRKIRQRLLTENRLTKYLLYAIGEIALVMIGILLALQVNTWKQNEAKKQKEQEYLVNLQAEFQINQKEFEIINKHRESVNRDLVHLMELSGASKPKVSKEQLSSLLNNAVYDYGSFAFEANTPVLQELISSGNLVNITNPKLKHYLVTWEQVMRGVMGTQEEYKKYRDAFLLLVVDQGSMIELGKADVFTEDVDALNFPETNKRLLQDPKAVNLFFLMHGEVSYYEKAIYPLVEEQIANILRLIEEEID